MHRRRWKRRRRRKRRIKASEADGRLSCMGQKLSGVVFGH